MMLTNRPGHHVLGHALFHGHPAAIPSTQHMVTGSRCAHHVPLAHRCLVLDQGSSPRLDAGCAIRHRQLSIVLPVRRLPQRVV